MNPTVAAQPPQDSKNRTLSENISITELYPPPNQIPLLGHWEDHAAFQCLCDAALAETGYSRIKDQGVQFSGHNPIGHLYHFVGAAGGGHDSGGSNGSSNGDGDNYHNNNNPRLPNGPPHNPTTPPGNRGYNPPPGPQGGQGNIGRHGGGGGGGGNHGPPGGGNSPPVRTEVLLLGPQGQRQPRVGIAKGRLDQKDSVCPTEVVEYKIP